MFYVSDHGESLGESGVYLHGYPYSLAPEVQKHVAMIMWFGRNYDDVDPDLLQELRTTRLSHDNIFHTLMGLFEIDSELYEPTKDVLRLSREAPRSADPAS
jgi:lipid A ethanolaminephosphotransferase